MEYENTDILDQNVLLSSALRVMADAPFKTIADHTKYKATALAHAFTLSAIASGIELKDEFNLSTIGFRPLKGTPILDASDRIIRLGKAADMHVLDLRPLRPSEKMNLVSSASYTSIRTGMLGGFSGFMAASFGSKFVQGNLETNTDIGFAIGFMTLGSALAATCAYKLTRDIPAIYNTSKATTIGLAIPAQSNDAINQEILFDNLAIAQPVIF